jgi:tRNA (pseudouridine54-N1)-methyltransferase
MRRFAVIGQRATSSPTFLMRDVPGTSGRLDVLIRCLRAGLLVSHGLRRDTVLYLVLLGDMATTLRFTGSDAKYIRPDEHQLAILVKKLLAWPCDSSSFVEMREGIALARGGIEVVLADAGPCARYVLDERGADVRSAELQPDALFFVGDDRGFPEGFAIDGAVPISVGPVSVQAEDAVVLIHNELDRR